MPRYLRLDFDLLFASEVWKARKLEEKGRALQSLILALEKGEIPDAWKRVAEVRTVGVPGKKKREAHPRETPFKPFYDVWEALWAETRKEPYVWDPKGRGAIRSLYSYTAGDVEIFRKRARKLLVELSNDRFHQLNASPAFLRSRWNELSGPVEIRTGPGMMTLAPACIRCGVSGRSTFNTQEGLICLPCYRGA